MRNKSIFIKSVLALFLAPHFLFANSFLTPHLQNYGSYKEISSSHGNKFRPLYGHVLPGVLNATKLTPMDGEAILKLSIVLPLNQEVELDQLLIDITNPNHARYQQFITQEEFIARYAPTTEQVTHVVNYLANNGLTTESVESNRLIINATGPVKAINTIFNTEIYYFADEQGLQFYAPAYELIVDDTLPIVSVLGLENRIKARSHIKALTPIKKHNAINGLTPANIQKAYSFSSSLNGAGQTLALFELDGFTASDITAYENAFNLPHVPLQVVLVGGFNGRPGSGAAEVTLDIELMIALAPGVQKIIVYEGPNTASGVLATYNKIATDNLAKSISTSWGLSETQSSGSFIQSESLVFKQMVAQGQSLYAASGDSAAYDDGLRLSVDDPASQPLVVGVGGTTLSLDTLGNYVSETTWSQGSSEGSGGGISSVWGIPSWQQGVANTNNKGSTTMRNVPDVSLDADPNTGYSIYFNGSWAIYGGTSCGSPLWAAFTALVNQQRSINQMGSLGFPSPLLYQAGFSGNYQTLFHDITTGNNSFYPAQAGYDLATGWGSFKGDALTTYLATTTSPPVCIRANPTSAITPASLQALAGQTLSYTATVTNNDTTACGASTFNLSAAVQNGFSANLQQSNLSIAPGQSASTSIGITSPSNASSGNHQFSVTAVNASDTSYTGAGSATFVVQSAALNLTISPQNARFTRRSIANFQITLTNGQNAVTNNSLTIQVRGPRSINATGTTNSNGQYTYALPITGSFPLGQYRITVTSIYNGHSVSSQTTFTVR